MLYGVLRRPWHQASLGITGNTLCVSCSDRGKNDDESDVDCGGTKCDRCADTLACHGVACTGPSDLRERAV